MQVVRMHPKLRLERDETDYCILTKILKSGDCERYFDDILRASRVRKLRPRSGAEAAPQAPLGGKLRRVD